MPVLKALPRAPGFIKDKLDGLADEVTYREITASVQNYGTIAAAGGVDISATAQNVKRTETGAEEAGSLAQVTATVDLAAGSVSGVKDVTVQAVAKNDMWMKTGWCIASWTRKTGLSSICTFRVSTTTKQSRRLSARLPTFDRMKIEEQKKAIRSGYDMDIIPSDLATYGGECKKPTPRFAEPQRKNVSAYAACLKPCRYQAEIG